MPGTTANGDDTGDVPLEPFIDEASDDSPATPLRGLAAATWESLRKSRNGNGNGRSRNDWVVDFGGREIDLFRDEETEKNADLTDSLLPRDLENDWLVDPE